MFEKVRKHFEHLLSRFIRARFGSSIRIHIRITHRTALELIIKINRVITISSPNYKRLTFTRLKHREQPIMQRNAILRDF